MDANEATRMVFSRIQTLDPQNASKIMGLLLFHDLPERDMIRLAFAPHSLLHSLILQAHTHLSLSSSSNITNNSTSLSSSTFSHLHKLEQTPNSASYASVAANSNSNFLDESHLHDHLSSLNDSDFFHPLPEPATSPTGNTDAMHFPSHAPKMGEQHRRSLSVSDAFLGSDPLGWKPCLYYARGYCKNGSNCRFLHDSADPIPIVGSPGKLDVMEQCQELLFRSKSLQPQRLSNFASGSSPYSTESLNFLLHQHQNDSQREAAVTALMLGEDVNKFGRARMERSDFLSAGGGMVNPASRQIYLTFPADSNFREEDVSNYFSIYGPVQDVRIPYQQKRMFGFVTFVYPETVKLILSKGNPHFIGDARVLVKPYKEKGKIPDKYRKQLQQADRGEFSVCTTLSGLDSRDAYDLQLGMQMQTSPRPPYGTQDLFLRRKLEEQADLQQTIDLQSQRLMTLQLLDAEKKHYHHNRNLSAGAVPFSSQSYSNAVVNQSLVLPTLSPDPSILKGQENCASPATTISLTATADQHSIQQAEYSGKEDSPNNGDCDFHDSVEHNLPDSLFASPTKSYGDPSSTTTVEADQSVNVSTSSLASFNNNNNNNNLVGSSLLLTTSTPDMASLESCFFQMPRSRWTPQATEERESTNRY